MKTILMALTLTLTLLAGHADAATCKKPGITINNHVSHGNYDPISIRKLEFHNGCTGKWQSEALSYDITVGREYVMSHYRRDNCRECSMTITDNLENAEGCTIKAFKVHYTLRGMSRRPDKDVVSGEIKPTSGKNPCKTGSNYVIDVK